MSKMPTFLLYTLPGKFTYRIDVTSENFRCSDDFRSFFPMNTFGTLRLIP